MLPLDILKECLAYLCRGLLETCSHVNSTPVQSVTELRYLYNKYIIRRYTTSFGKNIAWSPAPADQ
jgi:hypothetical protein